MVSTPARKIDVLSPTPNNGGQFSSLDVKPSPVSPIAEMQGPINVIPSMDRSELGRNFIGTPLREVTQIHTPTQDILTNIPIENIEVRPFHGGTIMFAKDMSWVIMNCPSEEAIAGNQPNQDSVGLIQLEDGRLLFLQADGVGQSVDGQNASGYAIRQIIQYGSDDIDANLALLASRMNEAHLMHEPAEVLPDLMRMARDESKRDKGSNTTLNQYRINPSKGVITARILGDGGIFDIHSDNQIERKIVGGHKQRLTTRAGQENSSGDIVEFPRTGDLVIMASDGIGDISNSDLVKLKDLFLSKDTEEFIRELDRIIPTLHDDDKSMLMYHHTGPSIG